MTTTYSKNTTLAILGSLLLLAGSCEVKSEQNVPSRSWELTWSDEFNGNADALPDTSKWKFDLGAGGWGNNELQNYTNRPSNISLDGNGALRITAKEEAYAGAGFTSARIKTQGVFTQKYGRFEARIKTPTGPGIWPAFWMLGSNIPQVSWPKCGEIDIMEQRGQESFITHGTLHGPGYSGGNAITKSYALTNGRFNTNYHVYAVEWGEDFVDFFVDDYLYKSVKKADVKGEWVYNQPFFLLLNVAVGGNFVGFPVKGTPFPQTMYIDYVKVYKQK
jgi:beta-glucanase (GH16 family)